MTETSAHYDHLKRGKFEKPRDVVEDYTLTADEKKTVLTEWKSSLMHVVSDDADAPEVRSTIETIDDALATLGR